MSKLTRTSILALAVALTPAAAPALASAASAPPPAQEVAPTSTHPRADDPAADYAQREAAAQTLEAFTGGGAGVYIGGSTLAIVALIVLLVLVL